MTTDHSATHGASITAKAQPTALGLCLTGALILVLWFGCLGIRDLFHPDEGRYAEIPREMVATGDYVMPRLNGLKYYEKPALAYWLTASTYQWAGVSPWSARFANALCGALTVLAIGLTARRLAGDRAAVLAALSLASCFQFFLFGQVLTVDMTVTLFLTLSLCALIAAGDTRLAPGQRRRWTLAMWAAMACGVLAKGLIGLVLPALVLVLYLAATRDLGLLRRLEWVRGLIVCFAIAAPWYLALQWRDPAFFDFFFVQQHFRRFTGGAYRTGAWYFFVLLVLVGGLPWTLHHLRALGGAWRAPSAPTNALQVSRLLGVWVLGILGFFTLSQSKLPGYIVPVFPALALLLGLMSAQRPALARAPVTGLAIAAALMLGAAGVIETRHLAASASAGASAVRWVTLLEPYARWLGLAGLVLGISAGLCHCWRAHAWRPVLTAAGGALLAFQIALLGTQTLADSLSSRPLVEAAEARSGRFDPALPFFSVNTYDQTLPPLLGRTVTIVDYGDELRFGLWAEPALSDTLERFRERWLAAPQAYAMISLVALEREQAAGLPMMVLARSARAAIVARR